MTIFIPKNKYYSEPAGSEITGESTYLNRRQFLSAGTALGVGSFIPTASGEGSVSSQYVALSYQPAQAPYTTEEALTPFEDAARYNNFYEFGTGKTDPARNAGGLITRPWSVAIEGEVAKPGLYNLEDLYRKQWLEERIYRLRCVEAWSMVIPWVGIPLHKILRQFEPTAKAKYVYFETLYDPKQMPDQASPFAAIDYPYKEGLRLDEAMHPLTILAVGMYGRELPNQNGAPLRLVVPWKYGFKSIKSIVKIRLQEAQPQTTWELSNAREYGFYANVNPEVDHPRWSQKTERRLPSSFFSVSRIKTQMFNGYAEQVAHLYKDMDLQKFY